MVVNPRADSGSTTTVNRALLPVTVLVIGIVLTTLMAMVQQRSAEREQALIFERQVIEEHVRFTNELDATIENFDNAVTFIEATFPSSVEEYRRFFANSPRLAGVSNLDPGVALIESVAPADVPQLVAREEALGNQGMEVLSLGPLLDGSHQVITRTAMPVDILGTSIIGLDVGSIGAEVFSEVVLPEDGRTMHVLDGQSGARAFFGNAATDDESVNLAVILEPGLRSSVPERPRHFGQLGHGGAEAEL